VADKCPAYMARRPMTGQEIEQRNQADIPTINFYVYEWCTRYNITVSEYIELMDKKKKKWEK